MTTNQPGSGVERIAAAFANPGKRAALMPYLMGGFPSVSGSCGVGKAYIDAGADLIELGLPFSDPLADGPVIHRAATEALAAGATVDAVLEVGGVLAEKVPVLAMTYFNLIEFRKIDPLLDRLVELGICGLIVPDLPLEESSVLLAACDARGLALVPLVAPTTDEERMEKICAVARGFIYTVSVTGTTGERQAESSGLAELVARVRRHTDLPVAIGFGIGDPEQAARVAEIADGAIVGTRLVREVAERGAAGEDAAAAVGAVVEEFAAAMR